MIAKLAAVAVLIVAGTSAITMANENLFGLGVPSETTPAIVSTFGLGPTESVTTSAPKPTLGVAVADLRPLAAPSRTVVVRRASSSWVDGSVGAWNVTKLTQHLRGELASPQHHGKVPAAELEGRTLRELTDIHDNLHEGYAWDGSSVTRSLVVTAQKTVSGNCPGGVCPVPASRQPVRRFLRR